MIKDQSDKRGSNSKYICRHPKNADLQNTGSKTDKKKLINIVGDFNAVLSVMDRTKQHPQPTGFN